jgi:hypothetical protein
MDLRAVFVATLAGLPGCLNCGGTYLEQASGTITADELAALADALELDDPEAVPCGEICSAAVFDDYLMATAGEPGECELTWVRPDGGAATAVLVMLNVLPVRVNPVPAK